MYVRGACQQRGPVVVVSTRPHQAAPTSALATAPSVTGPPLLGYFVLYLSCLGSMLGAGRGSAALGVREDRAMGARPRVVAYVRVSMEKQVEQGQSLDAQQAKLMTYAALYELNL